MNLDTMPESPAFRKFRLFLEARGEARGLLRGEAEMLLKALALRGIPVDDATRERVLACEDRGQIERWFERAMAATTGAEVFGAAG